MKNSRFIVAIMIAFASILVSCAKKEPFSTEYDKSLKAWESFKSSSNNTYTYTTTESTIDYTYSETKITVKNGQITNRDYSYYEFVVANGQDKYILANEWHENDLTLGRHTNEGAPLFTLDDVYYRAQNVWITAEKTRYEVVFETNNNGIISTAGYNIRGCKENCFIGIRIKSINK